MIKHKILIILMAVILISCSSTKHEGKTEAEVLYREAVELADDGRYLLATEKINTLKSQYPYSFYGTHAELLQADIFYKQENYVEAAASYKQFRDLYPRHKKMSYVIWQIAESYYNQLPPTYDRDLSFGFQAQNYYREILTKYPRSEYVEQAKQKINQCQELVEAKEKYIADFYYRTDKYEAARFRYLLIIEKFKTADLINYSKGRVVKASYKMEKYDDCIKYVSKYYETVSENIKKEILEFNNLCKKKFTTQSNSQEKS